MSLLTDELNLKCYVLYETKELLTEIYITIINILVFIVSIVIIIFNIIIIITINGINISIITVFVKSAWQIWYTKQLSSTILVSHDFWRQVSAHTFFIYIFFVQNLQHLWIKITLAIEQILIYSETKRLIFKYRTFDWNETKSKYIEISICTGKRQWRRPF